METLIFVLQASLLVFEIAPRFVSGDTCHDVFVTATSTTLQPDPWSIASPSAPLRLTIHAECPMHLEDFPMDAHACPLKFGSCKSVQMVTTKKRLI